MEEDVLGHDDGADNSGEGKRLRDAGDESVQEVNEGWARVEEVHRKADQHHKDHYSENALENLLTTFLQ